MENLEENLISEENLDRENQKYFSLVSLGGLVTGVLAVYAGATADWDTMKGFGYGVLAMDALMNITYRGIRYLQGPTPRE